MSDTCGTHRKDEKRKKGFSRKTRRYETTLNKQHRIRVILQWILKRIDVRLTGFLWLSRWISGEVLRQQRDNISGVFLTV
jgi:hypothetical protein